MPHSCYVFIGKTFLANTTWRVDLRVCFPVVVLRVHDHHQMGDHAHTPGQIARRDDHLNGATLKQVLHRAPLHLVETLVQVGDAVTQRFLQRLKAWCNLWKNLTKVPMHKNQV